MSAMVPTYVPREKLQIGMVVAEVVKDRSGRFLVGVDCELADKHLKIFKMWGVSSICVFLSEEAAKEFETENQEDAAGAVAAVDKETAQKYTKRLFHLVDLEQPVPHLLWELITGRVIEGKQKMAVAKKKSKK